MISCDQKLCAQIYRKLKLRLKLICFTLNLFCKTMNDRTVLLGFLLFNLITFSHVFHLRWGSLRKLVMLKLIKLVVYNYLPTNVASNVQNYTFYCYLCNLSHTVFQSIFNPTVVALDWPIRMDDAMTNDAMLFASEKNSGFPSFKWI